MPGARMGVCRRACASGQECMFGPARVCPRGGPASELCLASRAGAPSFHCEMQLCSASGLETVTEPRRACAVYERLRAGARVLVTGRERQRARVLPIEVSEGPSAKRTGVSNA
jgi:hypothetical protein